jgi:hypothetical protein
LFGILGLVNCAVGSLWLRKAIGDGGHMAPKCRNNAAKELERRWLAGVNPWAKDDAHAPCKNS